MKGGVCARCMHWSLLGGGHMNLIQLEYFVEAARLLNFTKAAESLCVTQQAVSKGVASLEAELGACLFKRQAGGLVLTGAGRRTLARAKSLLRDASLLVEDTRESCETSGRRVLRLGVADVVLGEYYTLRLDDVLAFEKTCQNVRLDIVEASSDACQEMLDSDNLDIAIVSGRADFRRFWTKRLQERPFVPFVGCGHRLADLDVVSVRELAGETFLIPRGSSMSIYEICEGFYDAGIAVPSLEQFIVPDCTPQLMMDHVYRGEGIAFMRDDNVDCIDERRGIVLNVDPAVFVSRLSIAMRRSLVGDEMVCALITYLERTVGKSSSL